MPDAQLAHTAAHAPTGRLVGRSPAVQRRRAAAAEHARRTGATIWDYPCSLGASPVQLARFDAEIGGLHHAIADANHDLYGDPPPLQRRDGGPGDLEGRDAHAVAARGTAGGGGRLPHLEAVQAAFGRHDVSGVRAHVGGAA